MEGKLNDKLKGKKIQSKADIVGETYDYIMDGTISKDSKEVSDLEIEQANELINPDPNSLDSRG